MDSAVTDPTVLAASWEGLAAEDVLGRAASRFAPRRTFATGFGAEGCVIIDMVARHRLTVDLFTLDTGLLFPETYDLWRRLEARYRISIRAVRPAESVDEQAAARGASLWEREPDACCALRKVAPLAAELGRFDAWVTAIRREQTPDRAGAATAERDARFGLVKVNPLLAWSSRQVWDYVRANGVPTNPLHDAGYPSIGCQPCTSPVGAGEDPRAGRWRGKAKTECGLHARSLHARSEAPQPQPRPQPQQG